MRFFSCFKCSSMLIFRITPVDYILFIRADVDLNINPNEVRDYKWVTADELKPMLEQPDKFTPWFKLICKTMLFEWWSHFGTPEFKKFIRETTIRRL